MNEYQKEAVLQDLKVVLPFDDNKDHNGQEQFHDRWAEGNVAAGGDQNIDVIIRAEWEALGEQLLQPIYQAGHAKTQEEYEEAYDRIFEVLDQLEERLHTREYLVGDQPTIADVRLYSVLVRFNIIYYFAYRLNRAQVQDYPTLFSYAKRLYAKEAFKKVTDFDALKRDYYGNQTDIQNPYHIIAKGPDMTVWE